MRQRCLILVILLLGVLTAAPVKADRASAEFHAQRAEKALKDRDWPTAQDLFRKSIAEDAAYLPAHAGLAEALLGAGDKGAGITAMRKAIALAEATNPLPPAWGQVLVRLRKRLAEVDTSGAQLDKIAEKYTADLIAYAERWLSKDPDAVAIAIKDVLRMRPDDRRAKAVLEKMEKAESVGWVPLFNGKDKAGWDWLDAKEWTVGQGTLVGNVEKVGMFAKTKELFKGDFDVRMDMKIVKAYSATPMVSLVTAYKSDRQQTMYGVFNDGIELREEDGADKTETKLAIRVTDVPTPIDPAAWVTYELRFRGDKVTAVVNGQILGTYPRTKTRAEGAIGLLIQHVNALFRRVEVHPR